MLTIPACQWVMQRLPDNMEVGGQVELSDADRELLIGLLKQGRPLPARFRASLFEDTKETELIWPGKTVELERVVLPFQSIEQIDEPRAEHAQQFDLFSVDSASGRQSGGWTNKLIWGDNKLILSALANGPLRKEIEAAGGLKLVYIDPPFDVGADFSVSVEIGDEGVTKDPSIIEEVAYRDTWGRGRDSYAAMMYSRLQLMHHLMAADSFIVVHLDWHVSHLVRSLMDEIFGSNAFVNEIIWHYYNKYSAAKSAFPRAHDNLIVYAKGDPGNINEVREMRDAPAKQLVRESVGGRLKNKRDESGKLIYQEVTDKKVDDVWRIPALQPASSEWTGYATQKHHELLERIIEAFSDPGDLVADFFAGSGTTLVAAERKGRRWIGSDLGRFAIHTSRKRLIGVQRELAEAGQQYRAFEILNLGSYERQYFAGIEAGSSGEKLEAAAVSRRSEYLELILNAYGAKRSEQLEPFHGVKDSACVFVGPLDAPVNQRDITKIIAAARKSGITRVDVLAFEFEMGIKPAMMDEAKELGITLTLRYIPNEVFDRRAIQRGQVKFYDVGYLEARPVYGKDGSVTIELTNFAVFYVQEDADAAAEGLRSGGSRVVVDNGQVVRVSKDKKGVVKREILTKKWSDWIDYWAVDFDFESQREVITQEVDSELKTVWTGRYIFENQWQDFRTRSSRELSLKSAPHTYDGPGEYKVAVKIVDVFGNDTTKVIKVKVK